MSENKKNPKLIFDDVFMILFNPITADGADAFDISFLNGTFIAASRYYPFVRLPRLKRLRDAIRYAYKAFKFVMNKATGEGLVDEGN